jgi:hypothetical protein
MLKLKLIGNEYLSYGIAKRATLCPVCKHEIRRGDAIVNPGIQPPKDNKLFWWGHPFCIAKLYPDALERVHGIPTKVWLYAELSWVADARPMGVIWELLAERLDEEAAKIIAKHAYKITVTLDIQSTERVNEYFHGPLCSIDPNRSDYFEAVTTLFAALPGRETKEAINDKAA